MKRVLLAEDEAIIGLYLGRLLEQQGYNVLGCYASGESLVDAFEKHLPDLVVADIHLAGKLNGVEAAQNIFRRFEEVPFLFISADTSFQAPDNLNINVLAKPFSDGEFITRVRALMA